MYLYMDGMTASMSVARAASWNIAAVNNNPFEYWITSSDPDYNVLMRRVQEFIEDKDNDVKINTVFTGSMFMELVGELGFLKISGCDELKKFWDDDYSQRMAIKGFLKDKTIGVKRLASMPDRITNTINLKNGNVCTRPTAINAYNAGPLESLELWWIQWKSFMFHTPLEIFSESDKSGAEAQLVCSLITPILRGKYPAITPEEQAISIPLQILCLAILDSIFVNILNSVAPGVWEAVRRRLCDALIVNKYPKICGIIASSYQRHEIIFIQEAAAVFVRHVREHPVLGKRYAVLAPQVTRE
jgi:hypothetical protein